MTLSSLTDLQLAREYVRLERIECASPIAAFEFDRAREEMTRRGLDISDFDADEVSPDERDIEFDIDARIAEHERSLWSGR